jgi:hypothetical protein
MREGPDPEFRRRVPRIATTSWSGRYVVEDDPESEWRECRVLDVSVLGVGLELFPTDSDNDSGLLVGHRLVIQVQAPVGESISVRLMGTVKNVGSGAQGGIRVGLEFVGLSDTEQAIVTVIEQLQVSW